MNPNKAYLEFDDLKKLGFDNIGFFMRDTSGFDYTSHDFENDNGCYVFSVNGVVIYVGETGNGIKTRLRQYRRGNPSQKTSRRVNELIEATVALDVNVDIWFMSESKIDTMNVSLENVEVVCGRMILERILISGYNPSWNRR